jgi:hypothetical protein
MGSLAVTLVTETGLFYLNQVEFDRLEAFINVRNYQAFLINSALCRY